MKMRESFQGEVKICNQFILNAASLSLFCSGHQNYYLVQDSMALVWICGQLAVYWLNYY